MEQFLHSIGITEEGTMSADGSYVIDISDSNMYGKYWSRLEKCDELEEDVESSQITDGPGSIQYVNDEFTITLLSDFDQDLYKLVIRKN